MRSCPDQGAGSSPLPLLHTGASSLFVSFCLCLLRFSKPPGCLLGIPALPLPVFTTLWIHTDWKNKCFKVAMNLASHQLIWYCKKSMKQVMRYVNKKECKKYFLQPLLYSFWIVVIISLSLQNWNIAIFSVANFQIVTRSCNILEHARLLIHLISTIIHEKYFHIFAYR